MSGQETISVNFGRPMPLFPLEQVVLMPQQAIPLHIFEPRYRQMIEAALDGSGQFAMAIFRGHRWKQEYHGRPPLRPAVCVGQIFSHEKLDDGRFNVLVQGICRARILEEIPADGEKLYREAMLEPVGIDTGEDAEETEHRLTPLRAHVQASLAEGPLHHLRSADRMLELTQNTHVATTMLMELLAASVVDDPAVRYRLLEEGDPEARATILTEELGRLERLIQRAERQIPPDLPRGCHWN
jgi:hypothetical protein